MMLKDILIGLAIGDAYGAGVEFQDRDWIRDHVDFTTFINARHNIQVSPDKVEAFTKNYNAWDYTDDTEMSIGLLKALISDAPFTESLLVRKWKGEYEKGIAMRGYGRNGHGSMAWYYSGEMSIKQVRDFQRNRPNPGNAPAMRALLLGLIDESLINEYAAINAKATHPNIKAVISSQCIARAAEFLLVKNGDAKNIFDYCAEKVDLDDEYKAYFKQVKTLPAYDQLSEEDFKILCGPQPIHEPYFLAGIKGLPSDSKYTTGAVLYVLSQSQNAMDALRKSVYLGGDVDSVASICVAIMAGVHGLDSLPTYMLEQVEGREYIEKLVERLAKNTILNIK